MFGIKIITIIVIELVAVTIGQLKYGEQGQWLYFAPGKPMVVTGPVIAGHEAPVSSCNSASQSEEPGVVVPAGEQTSKLNIYNIIILQYDPVAQPKIITQNPSRPPVALTPFLVETQSVREPSISSPETVVTQAPPVITTTVKEYGPRHLTRPIKPAPPVVAPPQPSTTSKPQPPVTEAASSALPVVVTTQSPPAVTQAPRQIIIDVRGEEANENYTVEAPKAPVPVIDGPLAPTAPPAIVVPSYAPVHHPQPIYTPVHRPILLPRPIRPAPPAVAHPQPSTISEPQPQATEAAPVAPPVVVVTQSPPAVTQSPRQIVFDVLDKESSENFTVETPKTPVPVIAEAEGSSSAPTAPSAIVVPSYAPVHHPQPIYTPVHRPILLPRPIRPAPPAVAHPQPSTISEPQPQVTEAASQAPPKVVTTQSPPVVIQAPRQIVIDVRDKEASENYTVDAPKGPVPVIDGPSAPTAPPAIVVPSYAPVHHPQPIYTPVHRPLLLPRPIRPAPPAVSHPQPSTISEPQPQVTEAAPVAPPVVVVTQSPPAVTQSPRKIVFNGQRYAANGYYHVEAPVVRPRPVYNPVPRTVLLPRPIRPASPTVATPQPSTFSEPQARVTEAASPAPPVVVTTQSPPAVTQEPIQIIIDAQSKNATAEAPKAPASVIVVPSAPSAAVPSSAPVPHPRLHYIPVHIPLLLPRPIRPAPPTVAPSQASSISEAQAPEPEAVLAPSVVITASPVVIEASEQLKFDFECQQGDGYYSVENECDAYIECKENKAVKYTCLYGLHFNPAAKYIEDLCASSSEVKCVTGDQELIPVTTTVRPTIEPIVKPVPVTHYPAPTKIVSSPATAVPSYTPVLHPRLHYIPVHIPLLLPRPIRPAPPTVSPSQPSSISEAQAPEPEAVLAPSVVIKASPVVIEASEQLKFDFECQQGDGYYSVENECDAYIECKENKAVKYTCLYGFYFNPAAKYIEDLCASSSEVKCVTGDQEQIPVPTTVRPRIEPIVQPKPVTQYPAPAPIVSPGIEPTAECPAEHGFFPLKNGDCSQYIRCHEGLATIMKCPKGLAFNPQTNICDWPSNVSNCKFIEAK